MAAKRKPSPVRRRTVGQLEAELQQRTGERDAALAREVALAEVLAVINSSPGDLAPVFNALLKKATRLCEADVGTLWTYDGEGFHPEVVFGSTNPAGRSVRGGSKPTPGTALGQIAAGEDLIHVADVTQHPDYLADAETKVRNSATGTRTNLCVALRKDGRLLGAITTGRKRVQPYSDRQIALLQSFAAQAVIAMENARLITETREALEQQTATAEVLQVINSSPGDLAPVFDAMLEKALSLCDAAFGLLRAYDGERYSTLAAQGEGAKAEAQRSPLASPGSALARIAQGERVIHIPDLIDTDAYRSGVPSRRRMVDDVGARSAIWIALRKDDAVLGVFVIYRTEVRAFADREIALLKNFAAQAVIAMENARLLTETREALDQQTATAEVLQVINSSPGELAPVFAAMLERAVRLCEFDFATLWTYDGSAFRPVARHQVPEGFWLYMQDYTPPVVARMASGERLVHIADLQQAGFYQTDFGREVERLGLDTVRSLLVVSLRTDDTLLGVIVAYRREVRPFSDKQIALLQNFAAQAVIAMENARLLTETREALEQRTATAEVLQVINSSPGDLTPVFDAILEKAHGLCDSAHGTLFLRDHDDHFRPAAMRGVTPIMAEQLGRGFPGWETPASRPLLAGEAFVHIRDVQQLEHPLARTAAEAGVRTLLSVPLRKGDTLLGMIVATRSEGRPFSEKQIALLQSFAAQAVIAMENARLLGELRQRTEEVAELNRGLEARVAEQVEELGRVGRLKRFLAPQLAELIVSQGDENILESHRREIVVVFCDLRGYTAFTETAEPEEVLDFLREYHGALGPLVAQFEGTLDQFSGDGIMVFFNDPLPIPDPAERAVKMAVAMREAAGSLTATWRERGRDLGFGAGIAQGYATLGQIGFSERSGYTAIGTVCNVAARLCAEAKDGQILLSQRVNVALKGSAVTEEVGALALKGLTQPVVTYNVPLAATQPALRVIEGGPQSV